MREDKPISSYVLTYVGVTLLIIIVLAFVGAIFVSLGPGEVAVLYNKITGSYSDPIIGPKWKFKLPWEGVIKDFYKIDYIEMSDKPGADYPPITALSKDGVNIVVEMTFTYEVDPTEFKSLAMNYPRIDYEQQRLVPLLRQTVRDVIARHTIDEIISQRDLVAKEIEDLYRERIAEDTTLSAIRLHEINLRKIKLPEKVEDAIEEKIASYERKIASQYEAERMIKLAEGEKQSKILKAQGEANATIILAKSQEEALRLIMSTVNDTDVAKIWMLRNLQDSNMPVIIIIGGNQQGMILDLSQLLQTEKANKQR